MLLLIIGSPVYRKPYEYYLLTWGGFYNEEYQIKHKEISGHHHFESDTDREKYVKKLRRIEKKLGARHLAINRHEGYTCREETVLHRVIEYSGIQFYSKCSMGVGYDYSTAAYHMEWKWYPGFNDYPLGESFNYNNVKIISEWITGHFLQEFKDRE